MKLNEIRNYLENLFSEEQDLSVKGILSEKDKRRLHEIEIELDQYWDILKERKKLKDTAENPLSGLKDLDTVDKIKS